MAASNITKKALASSLKELMTTTPFEKISITQICTSCGMNRKSFYYHFKDKYDLLNWIFDTDFASYKWDNAVSFSYNDRKEFLEDIYNQFFKNRGFYRKALKIEGQNSFYDHLRERIYPFLKKRIAFAFNNENVDEFYIDFFTDAVFGTIVRWLTDKDPMTPSQLLSKLDSLFQDAVSAVYYTSTQIGSNDKTL